jgi:hypothetical protein
MESGLRYIFANRTIIYIINLRYLLGMNIVYLFRSYGAQSVKNNALLLMLRNTFHQGVHINCLAKLNRFVHIVISKRGENTILFVSKK